MFILFHFSMKVLQGKRIARDGTPHFAVSHLGLFCLPMSHKKGRRTYVALVRSHALFAVHQTSWMHRLSCIFVVP